MTSQRGMLCAVSTTASGLGSRGGELGSAILLSISGPTLSLGSSLTEHLCFPPRAESSQVVTGWRSVTWEGQTNSIWRLAPDMGWPHY